MMTQTMTAERLGTSQPAFDFMVKTATADLLRQEAMALQSCEEDDGEVVHPQPIYHSRADRFLAQLERYLKAGISAQVSDGLADPKVQRLEATQRGLKGLMIAAASADMPLDVCNVDKGTLSEDLEAHEDDVTKSEFFSGTARAGYLKAGADAYGLVLLDETFGPDGPDTKTMGLASKCGVAGQFVVAAQLSAKALNAETDSYADLKILPHSYREQLDDPRNGSLRVLQQKAEAQHLVFGGPRVLMRPPFHPERYKAEDLEFFEQFVPSTRQFLWGTSLWAFAERYCASIGAFGWPSLVSGFETASQEFPNAIDGNGDQVEPVEIRVDDIVEKNLSDCRLLTFYPVKNLPLAAALNIPSAYIPNPDAPDQGNERIAACAVYTLLRIFVSHELKSRLRNAVGRQMTTQQLQTELTEWICGELCLGTSLENASEKDKATRPFRAAKIECTQPVTGVFVCKLDLTPISIVEEAHGLITLEEDSN